MEAAERARKEQSDSDVENGDESAMTNGQEISSSPAPTARAQRVKRERMSQAPPNRTRRTASVIPSTQIEDLTEDLSEDMI